MPKLSILIPVYFNESNLLKTYDLLNKDVLFELDSSGFDYEIIFVDDGSGDNSFEILQQLKSKNSKIKIVKLSRNFGTNNAILAGISIANGDCLTVISADLQDPPKIILELLEKWQKGFKVSLAVRESRSDPLISKIFSALFYKIFRLLALKNMPKKGFDTFLIDRKVVDFLKNNFEKNIFINGLILWSGYKTAEISYIRQKRLDGKSRWTFAKKFKYFIDCIIAFSYTPIRFVAIGGLIISLLSFLYFGMIVFNYFFYKVAIAGWSSIVCLILLSFGIQMISIGIIGEYLWRTLDSTRNRPNFVIDEIIE
ncbi:MAG: glycosyltransferase family 2 protein [Alphaproteobacteria bacterium]|nr:glycosyltransferase family 2 protein [Alphaproteobacteria bacterium]